MKRFIGFALILTSLGCSTSSQVAKMQEQKANQDMPTEFKSDELNPFKTGFVSFEEMTLIEVQRNPAQETGGLKQCQDFWKAQAGSIWSLTQTIETETGSASTFICDGSIRAKFPASSNQSCVSVKPYVQVGAGQKVRILPRKWALVGIQPRMEFGFIFQDLETAYQKKCVQKKSKDPSCATWERELGDKNKTGQASVAQANSERFIAVWPMIARKRPFFHCSSQTLQRALGNLGGPQKFKLREPARAPISDTIDFRSSSDRDTTLINY